MKISVNSMNALQRITFARSLDASKPTLNGVVLEPAGPGKVYAAATNGFLLAWGVLSLDEDDELSRSVIIPGKLADAIGEIKKPTSWVEITDDRAWLHHAGNPSLAMQWAEGTFPRWQKVVPSQESIVPWSGGRFAIGTLDQASKALGHPSGFLSQAVATKGNIYIAYRDGVFVLAMPYVFCSNGEADLSRQIRSALAASPSMEKAS